MKTKLISFLLISIVSVSLVSAQTDQAKTSFAILGGINFQNFNGKDFNGDKLENDIIPGYHAGINIQLPIAPEFFIQPGFLFSTKGAKNSLGSITTTYKLSYLELPINIVYKGLLGKGYVLVGFGPYAGYGIMGKSITEGGPVSIETDVEFKNVVEVGDPLLVAYFKAFDAGGNIFIGFELAKGIFLQVNSQLGMLNINPEDKRLPNDESVVKNTGYGFSLGYRF